MRKALVAFGALLLGGCATFSGDGGFSTVQDAAQAQLGKSTQRIRSDADAASVAQAVKQLLVQPLTADTAVQVALLNNRGLQSAYAELGIAEADLVQAGRMRNPGFSYARLERGSETEIERAFIFDLLGLLTIPARTRLEERRFEQAKAGATLEMLRIAAEARRAWVRAVAANESVKYFEQVKEAAETGAELARRMALAGNWGKLEQAREQLFYAEATAQLARAQSAAAAAREALTRLMGLWAEDLGYRLPERLNELPAGPLEAPNIEAEAMATRLDVQAARREVEALAESLGLTRATRFVNVLELSYLRNSEAPRPRQSGYEIELRLPIFDFGEARVAKAEAIYLQALNKAAHIAVNARSEVREAYLAYRAAYDLAKHYRDEVVPVRKRISEENMLRYGGMLIGTFELLADAREQVAGVNAYLGALRDFWLAEADLAAARLGRSAAGAQPAH
jgi:outer membrane protein TolC